nr:variable lymphocyte receptor 2 isoform S2 [Eriocheir sinensis]
MMGPREGFMEWLSWGVAKQDLCESPCRCPEDVVLASQRGIDCVGCNLTYISEGLDIPKVYPSITFSRNHIKSLSPDTFKPSTTLVSLDISNNELQSLPGSVFKPLQVLSILVLNNNNISTIDEEAFAGLDNLTQLDLSYNRIQRLPKEVFQDLESLVDLNLGFNPIGVLNESLLEHTPNLRTIDLSKLGLKSIPASFFMANLTKLERVSLAYNQLRVVPSKTLNTLRSSLLHLDLSGNSFTSLGVPQAAGERIQYDSAGRQHHHHHG